MDRIVFVLIVMKFERVEMIKREGFFKVYWVYVDLVIIGMIYGYNVLYFNVNIKIEMLNDDFDFLIWKIERKELKRR